MIIKTLLPFKSVVKSITSDNGTEFAQHQKVSKKLSADFYHPYSSWERGLNEYTYQTMYP